MFPLIKTWLWWKFPLWLWWPLLLLFVCGRHIMTEIARQMYYPQFSSISVSYTHLDVYKRQVQFVAH